MVCLAAHTQTTNKRPSIKAINEFCSGAYIRYSVVKSSIYIVFMNRYFRELGYYDQIQIDEVFETANKNIKNLNLLVKATYSMNGARRDYLYLHLHDFLGISVASCKELMEYIMSTGSKNSIMKQNSEVEKSDTAMTEKSSSSGNMNFKHVTECKKYMDSIEEVHTKTYKGLYQSLSDSSKIKLKSLQIAWIKAKDKKCADQQKKYSGGSAAGLVYCECIIGEVEKRIGVLGEMGIK